MDLVSELVFIIMQRPPKHLDAMLSPSSKMRQFYNLLQQGKASTDEEAAKHIYNSLPKDKRYIMLKRNLANKLTEIVLDTEYFDRGNIHSIRFECKKELTVAMKLLLQNVFHTSERIIQRIKVLAQQYHLTDIEINCLQQERTIASLKGLWNEVKEINSRIEELSQLDNRINQSTGWLELVQSRTRSFISKSSMVEYEAQQYADTIEGWISHTPNIFLQQNLLHLRIIEHLQSNDTRLIRESINKLNVLLESHPHLKTPAATIDYHTYLALCARMEGNLIDYRNALDVCLEITDYKAFNRFAIQVLHFGLLCKEKEFELASAVLHEVKSQPQYDLISSVDKAAWEIRKAYLFYAFQSEKPEVIAKFTPEYSRKVDINSLSNQSKFISKDKQGLNLMLTTIRILFLMEVHPDELHNEGENLRIYYYRHLKQANCERSKVFTRALYKLLMGNLNQGEMGRGINDFSTRLKELSNYQMIDNPELIRYEELGEMIIKRLQHRMAV